ncbi:histamine N-methyltransferase-like [Strongylocentrotus purpuratus]|uniref:Histamine N-methyltransferase n=1 Tax=Strongylocentrotus purpuratus TaxID=7668 RepID=A0A7M7PGI4_STRPU|nr:histamine N-methyltransferase-like [Strongylocentrotus purpuratus]
MLARTTTVEKMSAANSNIKPLTEDHERYEDVYYNAFYKVAQKDVVLEKVIQYFDATVMKRLTDVFGGGEELSLLGVGVGEGPHEFQFLKSLQSHYSSICNVAVDPNEGMLQTFKGRVATLNFDDKSSCHWFTGPLSQFVAESPLAGNKYNLISSIHSLYYTGDFETTFTQLASMMKDKGLMIIVCKNDSLNTKTFHKLTWLTESTQSNERLSSKNVREFAQSQGYDVTTVDIPVHWDITDVFDDQSDFGNKLLDFFTQAAYFRQTAPAELVDDLMSFWRSISTEDKNGRIVAPAHDEILLISK